MGLKYIEPIKSIILLLLVIMSITFTFSIWTYSPHLEPIGELPTVDISIGERLQIKDIIKPYKLTIQYEDGLKGTTDLQDIEKVTNEMSRWKISQLTLVDNEMNREKFKSFLEQPNQYTLYFHGQVPLPVYDEILTIEETDVPEKTFDYIVVTWDPKNIGFDVHFINREAGSHYEGKVVAKELLQSYQTIVTEGQEFPEYEQLQLNEPVYIALPSEGIQMKKRTFYQEEISPTRFRDALFNDPYAVRRTQVGSNIEEFGDDHALMTVHTDTKTLNFVHPAAESREMISATELLLGVFDSINEHGGWTDQFRYTYMNPYSRYVKFQLFSNGYPVYSDNSGLTTEITQTFGEGRVFHYIRPYYTLDGPFTDEDYTMPSGTAVAQMLMESDKLDFKMVEEITVGYYMTYDAERRIFIMEPSWYYLFKGDWIRFSPESLGGDQIGLE
ncbi:two-component system activity regulator YycH [Sporosarcina sp. USHLN248]|uniref:YycH family regulatory protein n=1 Tax=Sporosarcina sp. USHLN248 TaxID=3081300 RepID=UPI003016CDB1